MWLIGFFTAKIADTRMNMFYNEVGFSIWNTIDILLSFMMNNCHYTLQFAS